MDYFVPLLALFVSLSSLAWTVYMNRYQAKQAALTANLNLRAQVMARIADTPALLRFHDIGLEDLQAVGITAAEFAYLLVIYESGRILYDLHEHRGNPVLPAGTFRYKMCRSRDFRRAWPLIMRVCDETPFSQLMEATMHDLERELKSPA